uniref:Integrase, catalytic region, zinc finger, CCHC-type, peptidase aspartic, catalytic n=1 Tax=Tanacetum cinerariifolium TaxID=118510 RepID=A0A6L2K2H2_TANCI|nr:hypothetical protein [Tanacetum cinerariifolium]
MHNNIMAAGSRDRPPMLVTGRYAQWQSHFLRYIDIRPNGDALRKCILEEKEAIHLLLIGIGDEIYSTVDSCKTAHDMWIAIERLQQGNTRDLSSFGEETNKTADLDQHCSRISPQKLETASQITRDAIINPTTMASQDIATASARTIPPII